MKIQTYKNYYKTLGFGEEDLLGTWSLKTPPTDSEIKKSYRKLSMKYHPDVTKEENAAIYWEEILEAYKVLSDETSRIEYDTKSKFGINYDFKQELFNFEFSNDSNATSSIKDKYKKFDPKSVTDVGIELEEFQSLLEYNRWVVCKHCDGNGFDPHADDVFECELCEMNGLNENCGMCHGVGVMSFSTCPKCKGERLEEKLETIKLTEDMFNEDGEAFIQYKGSCDKFKVGKIGNLFIKIKKDE